jgi:hypothetical protein
MALTPPQASERPRDKFAPLLLGGYAALAETAWMGVAQATDVLDPLRTAAGRWLSVRLSVASHNVCLIVGILAARC